MPLDLSTLPTAAIREFCERNRIRRLAVFGSALRDDFTPESDIDVLVEFEAGATPGFAFFALQDELGAILGRRVDLNTPGSFRPPLREAILQRARNVYVAA